jgi:hypothetical protein
MVPPGKENENDGRWLDRDVAFAALGFFRQASEMLPVEPHIYRSNSGDLVAEFTSAHGMLTGVVTSDSFLAVATIDGKPQQFVLNLTNGFDGEVRRQLRQLSESLTK